MKKWNGNINIYRYSVQTKIVLPMLINIYIIEIPTFQIE